jgi:nucleotide-binding universal stress UspA family protein
MRIMVAVDVQGHPDTLVAEAVAWARRMGGSLDLVFASEAHGLVPADPRDDARWAAERNGESRRLDALHDALPEALRGQQRLLMGRPLDVLPYATLAYDLIIVGTHGRAGVPVGSVAARLVRTSPAPVLALRLGAVSQAA